MLISGLLLFILQKLNVMIGSGLKFNYENLYPIRKNMYLCNNNNLLVRDCGGPGAHNYLLKYANGLKANRVVFLLI